MLQYLFANTITKGLTILTYTWNGVELNWDHFLKNIFFYISICLGEKQFITHFTTCKPFLKHLYSSVTKDQNNLLLDETSKFHVFFFKFEWSMVFEKKLVKIVNFQFLQNCMGLNFFKVKHDFSKFLYIKET